MDKWVKDKKKNKYLITPKIQKVVKWLKKKRTKNKSKDSISPKSNRW